MARNGSGTYNLPAGNPVSNGTTIDATWANTTLTDIGSALTGSVAADGQTPMSGALKLATGSAASPALTFNAESSTGLYRPASSVLGFSVSGSEKVRITTTEMQFTGANLVVGSSAVTQVAGVSGTFQVSGSTAAASQAQLIRTSSDANPASIVFAKERSGAIVQDGDILGAMVFAGHDGVDRDSVGASIFAEVDGVPSSNDMPTALVFNTTADGAASPTERLRIAADGTVTVANKVQTSAGVLSPLTGFRNRIINGDFICDFRNQGNAVVWANSAGYTVDRWLAVVFATTGNVTFQRNGGSGLAGFPYFLRLTNNSSVSSLGATEFYAIEQKIEGVNVSDLAWGSSAAKTVTLSFWVRCSITGTFSCSLRNGGGTRSYVTTFTVNSANTWEKKSVTVAGETGGTWATDTNGGVLVDFTLAGGTTYTVSPNSWVAGQGLRATGTTQWSATNGATFDLTGVQLEIGSDVTEFEKRPYPLELILCQRYFETSGLNYYGYSMGAGTTSSGIWISFNTTKRTSPSVSFNSGAAFAVTSDTARQVSGNGFSYTVVTSGAAGTAFEISSRFWLAEAEL